MTNKKGAHKNVRHNKKAKKNHAPGTCTISALDGLYYITNWVESQDVYKSVQKHLAYIILF